MDWIIHFYNNKNNTTMDFTLQERVHTCNNATMFIAFLLFLVQLQQLQVQGSEEQGRDWPGGGLADGYYEQLHHGGKKLSYSVLCRTPVTSSQGGGGGGCRGRGRVVWQMGIMNSYTMEVRSSLIQYYAVHLLPQVKMEGGGGEGTGQVVVRGSYLTGVLSIWVEVFE